MPDLWNAHVWDAMFHLPSAMPVLEKVFRPMLIYVFLVILLRIFGKRELAQLNPFDLVVLLSLANTVQNAIIGEDTSLIGGMIGAFSLCAFNYVVVRFMFKHRRLDQLLEGTPTTLIEGGKLSQDGLAKEMLTEIDLTTLVHRQGFSSLEDVESCILEPGGAFFIKGKSPRREERLHAELSSKIDAITKQIDDLRSLLVGGNTNQA